MFKTVLKRHAKMLFDLQRTVPLLKAIQKKVRDGDIVVDVGCGLGILSLAAVKAGAKRVYAIDVDSEALDFARWQAGKLGVGKKICWLNDHSYNVDLIEKADVLIQETIGALAFDENFLPTLLNAKKRFLKKNGRIIPQEVWLIGVPIGPQRKPLASPSVLAKALSTKVKRQQLTIKKSWTFAKPQKCRGIMIWPTIVWTTGLVTECSPTSPKTHWHQTILPQGTRYPVVKDLRLSLNFKPHPQNPLYNTQIEWQIR